jgi:hypothetical protein
MTTHDCPWCDAPAEVRPDVDGLPLELLCASCSITIAIVPDTHGTSATLPAAA